MCKRAPSLISAFLFLFALPAMAQQIDESTTVVAVDIPVLVSADGQPVEGLTKENFEVSEKGEVLPLVGFQVIDVSTSRRVKASDKPVLPATRRNFLMFFDLSFANRAQLIRAARAAREILDQCHPSDRIAMVLFVPDRGLVPVLSFTSDFRQLRYALSGLEQMLNPKVKRIVKTGDGEVVSNEENGEEDTKDKDPLGLVFANVRSGGRVGMGLESRIGSAGDALLSFVGGGRGAGMAAEILADMETEYQKFNSRARGNRVRNFANSMGSLASMFRHLEGRKYLVLFSEGFDESFAGGANPLEISANIVLNDLRRVLDTFRESNWSIHAIDIGNRNNGLGRQGGESALFLMANDTGGKFYRNYNQPGSALANLLETTSLTYILTVQPPSITFDGSFNRVKIRLKNAPSGARLVDRRPGYVAPIRGEELYGDGWQARAADMIFSDREDGSLEVDVLAMPMRRVNESALVPVIVEAGVESLRNNLPKRGVSELEVTAYAIDPDDSIADFFNQRVKLDMGKIGEEPSTGGMRITDSMSLQPGTYRIRVLVRVGSGGVHALRTAAVVVPNYQGDNPVLAKPLFPDLGTSWVDVENSSDAIDAVFTVGDRAFSPLASPVVPRGRTVPVILRVDNLPPGPVKFTHGILDQDGEDTGITALQLVRESMVVKDGTLKILANFNPSSLPAGDYRLAVRLERNESDSSTAAEADFRIGE